MGIRIHRIEVVTDGGIDWAHLSEGMHDYFVGAESNHSGRTISSKRNQNTDALSKLSKQRNKSPGQRSASAIAAEKDIQLADWPLFQQ
jgi:hypothetical protein